MKGSRFLVVYSTIVTAAFAFVILTGFAAGSTKATFDELTVKRINVVEPDGTLRLVISDKANFPGTYIKGKEFKRADRDSTGMLFIDDEGTEMGGMIWGAKKDANGKVTSSGHLSFDQYNQDQTFSIDAGEEDGQRYSAISIWDRGDYPIQEGLEAGDRIRALPENQRQAEWKKFFATHPGDHPRIIFGRAGDKGSVLRLKDPDGHDRIVLRVAPNGDPVVQVLDASGKVISQMPPAK